MPRHTRMDESKANLILAGSIGGLLLVTAIVVLSASFRPASPAPAQPSEAASATTAAKLASTTTKASAILSPKPKPVEPTRTPEPAKAAPAPAPAPKPVAPQPKTLPEQMAHIPSGCTQLLIATAAKLGSNDGTVYVFNKESGHWLEKFRTTTRMGTNGLVDGGTRQQGSRTTPTGIWSIGSFAFGKAATPPTGTKMHYRQLKQNSYWSAEKGSEYNSWVDHYATGEHLISSANLQYEFAFSTGYNEKPNEWVYGRGTAIFLHVEDPPSYHNGYTAGCIGIPRDAIVQVFKLVDPSRNPHFAVGTLQKGTTTSIYAY